MRLQILAISIVSGFLLTAGMAHAQASSELPRFELGVQVTGLRLSALGENPAGIGGRFGYNFAQHLSLDAQLNHFPSNPSGNFGETQAMVGLKSGIREGKFGIFARGGVGVIHFGGGYFDQRLDRKDFFAADVGAVFEYYASRHIILRLDMADTIIPFGDTI